MSQQRHIFLPPDRSSVLVALPGVGSDAIYARRAFAPISQAQGIPMLSCSPSPEGVAVAYEQALNAAAECYDCVLVAGISIGSCIAVRWAARHTDQCVGVIAALPPWLAEPGASTWRRGAEPPAVLAARATAQALDRNGTEATIAAMAATSPPWLAAELSRSWRAAGASLARQFHQAATSVWPTPTDLATLSVPLAIVTVTGDALHPARIGREWARHAQGSTASRVSFDEWGANPAALGRSALCHF